MATFLFVLQAFLNLQKCVAKPEIAKLISKFGMITIPLFQLMAFAEVGGDEELILYEVYIRKSPDAMGFRSLVALSHNEYPRGRDRKFTFNLIIDSREINKLRILYQPQSPELMPLLETPEVAKSTRITNKVEYSPSTLAKYSKSIEVKISLLLESVMPNTNSDLRKQVINDVLRRLNLLLLEDRNEINNLNKTIVSNIKSLITGMRLHGKNDREQNKFLENISLAASGNLSSAILESCTGLS
jgi:hypothetical protein